MPFTWWKKRRRNRLLARPMDASWSEHLAALSFFNQLDDLQRQRLTGGVRIFIAEKHWTPCAGITLTDRMCVQIAAQAMRMVLHRDHDYYRNVRELLIYPDTYEVEHQRGDLPTIGQMSVAGQAVYRGPIILSWRDVERGLRHDDDGYNVVYHEFAHALDFQDGLIDGTPTLNDAAMRQRWIDVMTEHFQELVNTARAGRRATLREYGATNPAEFFAVATEAFFEKPDGLQRRLPDLYDLLATYYRQDPAAQQRNRPAER